MWLDSVELMQYDQAGMLKLAKLWFGRL